MGGRTYREPYDWTHPSYGFDQPYCKCTIFDSSPE